MSRPKAILQRLESGDQGTFGQFVLGDLVFFTGELPWRENASNSSCIPAGTYACVMTYSEHFKRKMYLVGPVEKRVGIRIHSANLMGDLTKGYKAQLNGCIALGEKFGWMDKQKAVLLSAPAVRKLEVYLKGASFDLEIRDVKEGESG